MADDMNDLADVNIAFYHQHIQQMPNNAGDSATYYVYLGEIVKYEIIIKKPKDCEMKGWKRRISQLSAHACISPIHDQTDQSTKTIISKSIEGERYPVILNADIKTAERKQMEENSFTFCPVVATYMDSVDSNIHVNSHQNELAYFKDDSTYIVPMSVCVREIPGHCYLAELSVVLWLCISPHKTSPEIEAKKDFQLNLSSPASNQKHVQQTGVSRILHVHDPPHFSVRFVSTGQQHLMLVQIKNHTRQTLKLINLTIIPNSSPAHDGREHVKDRSHSTEGSKSEFWNHMVSPAVSCGAMFPSILKGCEELALIHMLDLSAILSETELSFHTHLRWTHAGTDKEINTVYRLPKIRVRYPAFTVTVKCDDKIDAGKSFNLTYNIANNLQDFLSVRLYWNLDSQMALLQGLEYVGKTQLASNIVYTKHLDARTKLFYEEKCALELDGNKITLPDPYGISALEWDGVAVEDVESVTERLKLEQVKKSVICHDPDIFIGSCPRGCTIPVSVGFQILQPGLYEFGELMKLNLRWALPDSQSTLKQDSISTPASSDTVSTLSADDQLAASAELWRDRSGSTSSLQNPMGHSAEERRKTFATKSYSFGDLGPTLSAESDDASRLRFKSIKRSTAVLPARPPPPRSLSQAERDLTNRSNFLKKSFKIYIPNIP